MYGRCVDVHSFGGRGKDFRGIAIPNRWHGRFAWQEFKCSSLGPVFEYDSIIVEIRAMVSNKVVVVDGPTPMDVDRFAFDAADRSMS